MVPHHREKATAALLVVIGGFQGGLAAGAPWGRAAYGGGHPGTLPDRLRVISAVAALGYGAGAVLILCDSGSPHARHRAFTGLSCVMSIGTVANGASRSPVERGLWTPMTAVAAVLAWRSRST